MLVSQVLIIFNTVRKFPGQNIEGLADKIHETYGDLDAARFMIHGDSKYWTIRDRLPYLNCVQEKEGGYYYYNPKIKPYSKDKILNCFIENILNDEAKTHKTA
jgi:DNA-directed RNA polymerase delta subunit